VQAWNFDGPATIVQGDRSAEVECHFDVTDQGSHVGWFGWYQGAVPAEEPETGAARLVLGPGNESDIVVADMYPGTGEGWFTGTGAPPR
jgi:hypothetical protein